MMSTLGTFPYILQCVYQNQIACEFSSFASVHLFSLHFFVFPSRYHMSQFSS